MPAPTPPVDGSLAWERNWLVPILDDVIDTRRTTAVTVVRRTGWSQWRLMDQVTPANFATLRAKFGEIMWLCDEGLEPAVGTADNVAHELERITHIAAGG